jgi:hypothetical protein
MFISRKGDGLQTNPLHVLLKDMHHAGVSDVVDAKPFDFFNGKIKNPFDDFEAPNPHILDIPQETMTQAQPLPSIEGQSDTSAVQKAPKETVKASQTTRDAADLFWQFGAENAKIQVIISSEVEQGMHPLSIKAKVLFEKMLISIGLKESDISYAVLNRADKFSKVEKENVHQKLKELNEASFKIFVGEEAVKCIFDQTLIRSRQRDMTFENKACGLLMHPESLMTQPLLKKLAWQDLLKFQRTIKGLVS